MIKQMADYVAFLDQEIERCSKQVDELPPGKILSTRDGKHFKWYVRTQNGLEYLPKAQRKQAIKLTFKRYLQERLAALKNEKNAVNLYISNHDDIDRVDREFCSPESPYSELLTEIISKPMEVEYAAWQKAPFKTNEAFPEKKIHEADNGILTRSKSEAAIASKLFKAGIPFRYECELVINGVSYYPDFTIIKPKTGKIVYLEHLGMMDNHNYVRKVMAKIQLYQNAGIFLGDTLFITFETSDCPLRYQDVDNLIKRFQEY